MILQNLVTAVIIIVLAVIATNYFTNKEYKK